MKRDRVTGENGKQEGSKWKCESLATATRLKEAGYGGGLAGFLEV